MEKQNMSTKTQKLNNRLHSTFASMVFSGIAMIVYSIMFVGTSFAWFTDTSASAENHLQVGMMSVSLETYDKDNSTFDIIASGDQIFDSNDWKPGKSETKYIAVENTGEIPIHYELQLSIDESKTGQDAISFPYSIGNYNFNTYDDFDVWLANNGIEFSNLNQRLEDNLVISGNEFEYDRDLGEYAEGDSIFSETDIDDETRILKDVSYYSNITLKSLLDDASDTDLQLDKTNERPSIISGDLEPGQRRAVAITITMPNDVTYAVMGAKVTFSFNLIATQKDLDGVTLNQIINGVTSTDLSPTDLSPTDLSPTDLSPTDLSPTDLSPTDLSPTDLSPTDLSPTDMSNIINEQIKQNAMPFGIAFAI